jgi:hypothetical protein
MDKPSPSFLSSQIQISQEEGQRGHREPGQSNISPQSVVETPDHVSPEQKLGISRSLNERAQKGNVGAQKVQRQADENMRQDAKEVREGELEKGLQDEECDAASKNREQKCETGMNKNDRSVQRNLELTILRGDSGDASLQLELGLEQQRNIGKSKEAVQVAERARYEKDEQEQNTQEEQQEEEQGGGEGQEEQEIKEIK